MTEFKRGIAFIHIDVVSMTFVLRQGVVKTSSWPCKLLTWPLLVLDASDAEGIYFFCVRIALWERPKIYESSNKANCRPEKSSIMLLSLLNFEGSLVSENMAWMPVSVFSPSASVLPVSSVGLDSVSTAPVNLYSCPVLFSHPPVWTLWREQTR